MGLVQPQRCSGAGAAAGADAGGWAGQGSVSAPVVQGLYMPCRDGRTWGHGCRCTLQSGTVRFSVVPRAQRKVLGSAAGHGAGERLPARPALCRM